MSTHKHIDKLCAAALALCLLLTLAFMNGESLGLQPAGSVMGYASRLFDTERVHTIDIVMDDWEGFLETCENEEYASCAVVIDGEAYKNTGIRAKGNTSLSMVSAMNSNRYSFKLEFDYYDSGRTYYGLDKLSLNNLIQDTTYMKDYLTYRMMGAFGVSAPLCSYVYITVNGEDWGLYLAVEGVEDAFLRRNYGSDPGELYKPDSSSFGGGRGNGRAFNMEDFMEEDGTFPSPPEGQRAHDGRRLDDDQMGGGPAGGFGVGPDGGGPAGGFGGGPDDGGFAGGPGGGMGSDDVKLRYSGDDPDSYPNIFDNAKTDITEADQARLIAALKALDSGENLENAVDIEAVLRYFVVHNFVCNGDSYTGSIVHNYYLYEENGRLSMIPWDYNLAYGTFQNSDASSAVNSPIDTPVSGNDSRPMLDWIFANEACTSLYHQYFQQFLETVDISGLIGQAEALIAPYVEKDPTQFYSYEEFETGVTALRTFCELRSESVLGQLDGSIPSTAEGQSLNTSGLIDASSLTLSDMGTMSHGGQNPGERAFGGISGPKLSGENGKDTWSPSDAAGTVDPEPPSENKSEADAGSSQVEILRQGPPQFVDRSASGEAPNEVNETSLLLAGVSLLILFAGTLFVRLYRRRKS